MRHVLSVAAVANYAATVWHACLAEKVNPALRVAEVVRMAAIAGAITLAGLALLWTPRPKIGSLVLVAVFIVGLVIGIAEHFLVAGPNNLFDVGNGAWTISFKISVWVLPFLEVAGLSAAGRVLATRS
jgi:hypothetical protein